MKDNPYIPGTIIRPAVRYPNREAAQNTADLLAGDRDDDWSYRVEDDGYGAFVIGVYDETGELAGYWSL